MPAADLGERATDRAGRAPPGVGEGAEGLGPVGRLGDQLGALLAQRGDHPRLDGGRVDRAPEGAVVGLDDQTHLDEEGEGLLQLTALADAPVGGADAAGVDDLLVERGGLVLEDAALVLPQGHDSPPLTPNPGGIVPHAPQPYAVKRRTDPPHRRTVGGSVTRDGGVRPGSLPEAGLERVELAPEHGREVVAELLEPLLDLRDLGLPLLGVDRERLRRAARR